MGVLRVIALLLNGAWVAILLIALTPVVFFSAPTSIPWSFVGTMALFAATAVLSAILIWRDTRGLVPPKLLRRLALLLNAAGLFLATIGWATALSGGPGPASAAPAIVAGIFTASVLLNLVVIARRRSAALAPAEASGA